MFKVGDEVFVKTWEEMVEEFGVDGDGKPKTGDSAFPRGLKSICGTKGVIKSITDGFYYTLNTSSGIGLLATELKPVRDYKYDKVYPKKTH